MRVMSVKEFAQRYRLSRRHVYDLLREGRLKGRRFGKAWRVIDEASEDVRADDHKDDGRAS